MFTSRWPSPLSNLLRHSLTKPAQALLRRPLCTSPPPPTFTLKSPSILRSYRLAFAFALPVIALSSPLLSPSHKKTLQCASDRSYAVAPTTPSSTPAATSPKEAESIINWSELSFGTVSGICVGIFVKKGLKYFSSRSFINVNWSNVNNAYDSVITKKSGVATGGNRVVGLSSAFLDFVTANVQSRATFVAGLLLGFRIG
ncbi:hypothetical protein P7C70_g4584, partial [Phenoliferia sp. Uapishka_3]